MIRTHGLSKRYAESDRAALSGVDMHVGKGEIFGLLGPNGAGKTTLISILTGLIEPTSGGFSVFGVDHQDDRKQLKGRVGIVPQEYALYPTLTATENLKFFGRMQGMGGNDLSESIAAHLEELVLTPHANKQVQKLSGGMKRMVNLIAGVLHRPELLFLDEPTVGVDVHSRKQILRMIERLHQDGMTIFYTSHLMEEAEKLCTRVAILSQGQVVCDGVPAELIAEEPETRSLEQVFLQKVGAITPRDA